MPKLLLFLLLLLPMRVYGQNSNDGKVFEYDKNASLELQEVGVGHRGQVAIHDISYASPKGGFVPAYLIVPAGKGPFAAIVWGHWYWAGSEFANRKEFLEEAVALAPSGVVSLLISGPIGRPSYVQPKSLFTEEGAGYLVQEVVDMRRAADLLLSRKDVDPKRLAYVGHSYNATVGGILSGVDKRFVAFVLMAGSLSNQVDVNTKTYQNIRNKMGPEKFDGVMEHYAYLDAGKYVSHASPATVFLQYAEREDFLTPEVSKRYAENVSEPKQYKLYDAPHALNAEARRDRIAFLVEQLRLKQVDKNAVSKVPELPQPDK